MCVMVLGVLSMAPLMLWLSLDFWLIDKCERADVWKISVHTNDVNISTKISLLWRQGQLARSARLQLGGIKGWQIMLYTSSIY